jgi:hypothetical protein
MSCGVLGCFNVAATAATADEELPAGTETILLAAPVGVAGTPS